MSDSAKSTKKILIVDDSALMRRVFCDIINRDSRFEVGDLASNGKEALELLRTKQYDAVVLDVNMPQMSGLELLRLLQQYRIPAKVMMASSDTAEGTKTTLDALELGALDFVHKPDNAGDYRGDVFRKDFLDTLDAVVKSHLPGYDAKGKPQAVKPVAQAVGSKRQPVTGRKIVAIASSTGGPKALQTVIPKLPKQLKAPVLLVQHMPKGFTASLAERLDGLSELKVKEAVEGEPLENGTVYVSMSGQHLNVRSGPGGRSVIHYSDEPSREGVKPCANYMYESLCDSPFDQVVCVVLTGMGADGTDGIRNLKKQKKTYVIAQDQESSIVYGMPRSVVKASLADQVMHLEQIAQEIVLSVGV